AGRARRGRAERSSVMSAELVRSIAAIAIVAAPATAFFALALAAWARRPLSERATVRVVALAFSAATLAVGVSAAAMLDAELTEVRVPLGSWFAVPHYGFGVTLVLDRLSLPFAAFSAVLLGLIAAFSARYLHRERGFGRFYLLLALFGVGV